MLMSHHFRQWQNNPFIGWTDVFSRGIMPKGNHMTNTRPPFIQKPKSLEKLEQKLGKTIPLNPNMLSSIKLFVITPLLLLSFNKNTILPDGPILPLGLFALFCLMDYLDGIVARVRSLSTPFGEIYDRFREFREAYGK